MTTTAWRVAWQMPVDVSVSPDHSSLGRVTMTTSGTSEGTGVVQVAIGLDVRLTLVTVGGPIAIVGLEATGHVIPGVLELLHDEAHDPAQEPGSTAAASPAPEAETTPAPAADPDAARHAGVTSLHTSTAESPSRQLVAELLPDLDETILTPVGIPGPEAPGFPIADNVDDDETILGAQAAQHGDDDLDVERDDEDFDATVIGRSSEPVARILRVDVTDADGTRGYELDGALYVGRAPRVPAERSAEPGGLAVVRSATPHVSSTHLQVWAENGQLLVRDLWSTNGTVFASASGAPFRLEPGETLPLPPGARLQLADDVLVTPAPVDRGGVAHTRGSATEAGAEEAQETSGAQ
jgi:hypothetical protein